MSTTLNRNLILLPLPTLGPSTVFERAAFLYTALDSGWIRVMFRKNDGTLTTRVCTRNPTLVGKYGTDADIKAIRESEHADLADYNIVFFDFMNGGLRSFRVSQVESCCIDSECLENFH